MGYFARATLVALVAVGFFSLSLPFLLRAIGVERAFPVHASGVVLVTGASSGIGQHSARDLAQRGYTVFAGVRSDKDFEGLAKGPLDNLLPVKLDVTKQASVDAAFATVSALCAERGLPFVGLVNNAGVSAKFPMETVSIDEAKWVYEVNIFGVHRVTSKFLPQLRRDKGRVIMVGSVAGLVATELQGVYSGTKFALEGVTDVLRLEMDAFDVSVSMVEPAYVKTEIGRKGMISDIKKEMKLTSEQLATYSHVLEGYNEKREKNFKDAPGPEVTSEAIADAMQNPFPRTRYQVAHAGGFPAWLLVKLVQTIPDRVADFLRLKVF